ncbi:MAG: 16S rRNA (guanine(527)-N(7))-methyltransferase RsmG [Bacteroidales bacterium]|nr:16S rRNA (guanine(527)-N(7))-methyltransferase RsmG [Bacteroidales bacterium]
MEEILKYFPNISEEQKEQFAELGPIYRDWNSKINLISRKDIDSLYLHHILHSLAIAKAFSFQSGFRILDVGTGGGFPGIPLAILFPEASFTLCDSIGKKVKVAQEVASAINLKNVICVHSRVEDIKEEYDYIVSRAVTELENFIPWVKGKYTSGIIYLKGGDLNNEISNCMSRYKMDKNKVTLFDINSWFKEEYFEGKKIIFVAR